MDAVRNILDWLSESSRNLSEVQKREIHHVLQSLKSQLESRTGIGLSNEYHQTHQFSKKMPSTEDRNETKFHKVTNKFDKKHASLESKIQQVTNNISKETGYIDGKIDTIVKEYNEQMKMLRNQIRDLENDQKEREKNNISDRDIDHLTKSLESLMNSIVSEPCPPKFNPPHPPPHYDCPPPYHPYQPTIPNQNISHFPAHFSPQFFMAPRRPGPSMAQPLFSYPSNHIGPNVLKPSSCGKNEKIYRFSGNSGSGPSGRTDLNATTYTDHQKTRFYRPHPSSNEGEGNGDLRKNYCDSYWKKTDPRHQQHRFKPESLSPANGKCHHAAPSRNDRFGADSSRCQFENSADRGKSKRFQQFGKNRQQNHDEGEDSDSSTTSRVSLKDTRKKSTVHKKTGHPHDFKFAKNKNLPSTSTDKTPNFQSRPKNFGDGGNHDTSTVYPGFPKFIQKELASKTKIEDPRSSTATNKNLQSTKKSDSSELEKLMYPSKTEALKKGIDIYKRLEPPSICLGKVNGIPFSRPAHCLEDIYKFEEEFGPCQVIRY